MRRFVLIAVALLSLIGILGGLPPGRVAAPAGCGGLFFSEYVEGSGSNRAVEIFNGTGDTVDLAAFTVELYTNGSNTPGQSVALVGSLADRETFVLAHPMAAFAVSANQLHSGVANFTGDDAILLRHSSTVVDVIGQVGLDPGVEWGFGETSTQDNTLRRKPSVSAGDANSADAFEPMLEWDGFASDAFDGLSFHEADCAGLAATDTPSPTLDPVPVTDTPTPTASPTSPASATSTATPTAIAITGEIYLNEYLAAPAVGTDEYVELYNNNAFAVDLDGWQIDDGEGGASPYTLGGGSVIPAYGVILVERSFGLNNDGDSVRLLSPDGEVRDSHSYSIHPGSGVAWSRYPDGIGDWRTDLPSSPGTPNPTPTGTVTPSSTAELTPTATSTTTPMHGVTATATSTTTNDPTATATPTATTLAGGVYLNEYLAAPAGGADEYVEVYNSNAFAVDLEGWQIDDVEGGASPYTLGVGSSIAANGVILIERSFGLNNDGDSVRLIAPDGDLRDSHTYTSHPGSGVAWSRYPDGIGGWWDDLPPSPGQPNPAPPPTTTPTPTTTATATPTATTIPGGVYLNEYLAAPPTGVSEYVELYNTNGFAVDLSGWRIDDSEGGTNPYTLPVGEVIPAGSVYLVERTFGLNNEGDSVRLFAPDSDLRDSHTYTSDPGSGVAWSRYPDGIGGWRDDLPSSAGQPNPAPPPTATSTPTATVTATPSMTPTATSIPGGVYLNEYLAAPPTGTSEYVELHNSNTFPVDLSGWRIDDSEGGTNPYTLPAGEVIPADSVYLVERTFGLNNDGDSVRLFAPDGDLRDSHSYISNPGRGVAWSRYPDGIGGWRDDLPPSPGQPNPTPPPTATPTSTATVTPTVTVRPTATPTLEATSIPGGVYLNEYLAAPPTGTSEYVELFNTNAFAVDLSGWRIDDSEGGTSHYTLPAGTFVAANSVYLVVRTFGLNNDGDNVRLFAPDGDLRDSHTYTGNPGSGVAWSRYPDGIGGWRDDLPPSPGQPNPAPPPTATPTSSATVTAAATPTPTATATPTPTSVPGGVYLNEYLAAPTAEASEYVELYNSNAFAVDLSGWWIDDSEGGTSPYTLPAGEVILANDVYLVERTFGLNNEGDSVRLLAPDGNLRDSHSYIDALRNIPWSRAGDGADEWTDRYPRTPGQPNRPAVLTLSGHLYLGQPPAAGVVIRDHPIGLYGGDDPDLPVRWLANAFTHFDGGYSLVHDTGATLYRYYTLRPAPLSGHTWSGASSPHGEARPPDRIRLGGLPTGSYPDNNFWLAPLPSPTPTPTSLPPATPPATFTPTASATARASATPTSTGPPQPTSTPAPPAFITLNEILPAPRDIDFDGSGMADADDEYIELYNPQAEAVDLGSWQMDDGEGGSDPYRIAADTILSAHGFILFFRRDTGLALNNDGDIVRLLAPDGQTLIDSFTYEQTHPDVPWSRTIDGAGEWTETYPPSPGGPNLAPTPTPSATLRATTTPTPTPSPTLSPTAMPTAAPPGFLVLNEFLPSPRAIDFDGDGETDLLDEYIELYNPQPLSVNVGGWLLDDAGGGSRPFTFAAGAEIPARGFLLLFRSHTGVVLNNDADTVRLLAPDGLTEIDRREYDHSSPDIPWSRTIDGGGEWTETYPPSPGGPNLAPTPTPSATHTPTPSPTLSPTATPTGAPPGYVTLNELLAFTGSIDFDGSGVADTDDEYVELFNPHRQTLDLSNWQIDDAEGGVRPYRLPPGSLIPAQGFLLFFRRDTGLALNNDGDFARLFDPAGNVIDSFFFARSHRDIPWSRTVDGAGEWTETYSPSPGGPNLAPTPTITPTVTPTPTLTPTPFPTPVEGAVALNELLPAPRTLDWNQDGVVDDNDEWIELYNGGDFPADLSGWRLWKGRIGPDGLPDGFYYQFPPDALIPARGYLVLFRRQSRLSLPGVDGTLNLVRPDNRIADSFSWPHSPGYDRSFSRYPDGVGPWGVVDISIGLPNRPFPEPDPPRPPASPNRDSGLGVGLEPIARAYELAIDTRMTIEGQVSTPPGPFGPRVLYLQDASAGIQLYLREGDYPAIAFGDRLRVTGFVRSFHGQRELSIPGPSWLTWLGPGPSLRPRFVRTGMVGEAFENQLLIVVGRAVGFRNNSFWLDDGSGQVRITVDADLPWERPFLPRNSTWAVVGVVSQYDDIYRLLPRYPADISGPPGLLPVTGDR